MKKSEITAHLEAELRRRLDSTFDPRATAREIVAAFEGAVEWEPEEPELPRRVDVSWASIDPSKPSRPVLVAPTPDGGVRDLLFWEAEAVVVAYNREREEERIEAEIDDANLAEGLERICREAIDAEIQVAVDAERDRCLGVFDWLLASLPQGWDYARRMTKGARHKVASGKRVEADDVPTAAAVQPFPSPAWSAAALTEPDQFTPEPCAGEGQFPRKIVVYEMIEPGGDCDLGDKAKAEAARRWEAEPKLRLWKSVTTGLLETERKARERLREERDRAAAEREHYRREVRRAAEKEE